MESTDSSFQYRMPGLADAEQHLPTTVLALEALRHGIGGFLLLDNVTFSAHVNMLGHVTDLPCRLC